MTLQQVEKLFVDAIGVASITNPREPIVIVIDGLDGTDRNCLNDTATTFSTLFDTLSKYPNAKVLISSRLENDIQTPFAAPLRAGHIKCIHLNAYEHIYAYLKTRLKRTAKKAGLDPKRWPGQKHLEQLTAGASGLFIWAETVAELIDTQVLIFGGEGLYRVLRRLGSEGMGDINKLYSVILGLTYDKGVDDRILKIFRTVVGAIIQIKQPLSLSHLKHMLNVDWQDPRIRHSYPDGLQGFVRQLRPVFRLVAPAGVSMMEEAMSIPLLHKSFVKFITGNQMEERFRVDLEVCQSEIVMHCLQRLSKTYSAIPGIPDDGPEDSDDDSETHMNTSLRYALLFCASHLPRRQGITFGVIIDSGNPDMDLPEFHRLLQMSSNDQHAGPLGIHISEDRSRIIATCDNRVDHWDTASGQSIKSPLAPIVAPIALQRVLGFESTRITRKGRYVFKTDFTAFSASGKLVLSSDSDEFNGKRPLRLWPGNRAANIEIGGLRLKKYKGNPWREDSAFRFVEFSPDESRIAGMSHENTLYLWDVATRALLGSSSLRLLSSAESISFTTDGKNIVISHANKPSTVWTHSGDGNLVNLPMMSRLPHIHNSAFFDVTQTAHTFDAAGTNHPQNARWYPRRESDTGFWAYINNHIIRGDDDGSVVIVPVGRGSKPQSQPWQSRLKLHV
ncbi:hypothetical protein FPV67DRAFT_1215549 [Lyophyllum atratum]|nr:hypothetical protein FPV67DRAFT_1215549 [Lyophyllum atratum]